MSSNIEFDIVDQAYRFFGDRFPVVNDDNILETGPAFTYIESFAHYVEARVEDVFEVDVDMLNEYLRTHLPEDVLWYKEVAPVMCDLILYWRNEYLKLKYPESYKR